MMCRVTHRLKVAISVFAALAAALPLSGRAERRAASSQPASAEMTVLQKEIISKLSGDGEIRPGVKLANRSTLENRQEVRAYIAELLRRLGLEPKRQTYGTEGENIFAILSCSRPDAEAVVFGAHYDSARNSPGANDNASGVATVAAVAREMKRFKIRSRDIIFVFFDEEERGLRGSRAFAQLLKDEKRAIHSVHTIDQMGWDQDGDRAIELEVPYEGALALYQKAAAALKMNIPIHITTEQGSDHSAFRRMGYPAVGITEEYRNKDTTPHIHRPGDILETVNFDYLASTTTLVVEVMRMLAR
jgi:acetylornithine deacetylase/succinyl-diaminopimelate desuccinylase-like protein